MENKEAPYPADTKAKGWRFELDYEAIDQSGTWALAAQAGQEARPLLLMQWLVSWRQAPCGSLPSDEAVVAALIGVNLKTWAKYRNVLMRGWWLAADGLMYHPTITARVLEMIDYRKKAAERVAKHKAAKREQHGANTLPTGDEYVKNDTGTGTGTGTFNTKPPDGGEAQAPAARKRAASFDAKAIELPDWLDAELWGRWVDDRKERKKPITKDGAKTQLSKLDEYRLSGRSPKEVIEHSIASGYQGLFPPSRQLPSANQSTQTVSINPAVEETRRMLAEQDARWEAIKRERAEKKAREAQEQQA